jgi:hypothetical protein
MWWELRAADLCLAKGECAARENLIAGGILIMSWHALFGMLGVAYVVAAAIAIVKGVSAGRGSPPLNLPSSLNSSPRTEMVR